MKPHSALSRRLKKLGACGKAVAYARDHETLTEAWTACERGDWMLWLAAREPKMFASATRQEVVLAACAVWREIAAPRTKDKRVIACIETVESWARGEGATLGEVRKARTAAYTAFTSAFTACTADAVFAAAYIAFAADADYAPYATADAAYNIAASVTADATAAVYRGYRVELAKARKRAADVVRGRFEARS